MLRIFVNSGVGFVASATVSFWRHSYSFPRVSSCIHLDLIIARGTTTTTTTTTTMSTQTHLSSSSSTVNLLDMASSMLASAVSASLSIRSLAQPSSSDEDLKNARLKADGSFVTDADFAAQSIITRAVQRVSERVRILGEENPEGVARLADDDKLQYSNSDKNIYERCREELFLRFKQQRPDAAATNAEITLPLSSSATEKTTVASANYTLSEEEEKDVIVEASRVCVIIDPLDGTKSYAKGDYDAVSVLISLNLDFQPYFGVICKPFGYEGLSPIMDTQCAAVYGGLLIGGAYIAGGKPLDVYTAGTSTETEDLPRAIISSSRSKGVVEDVCRHLGKIGLIHPEPMHISGAGEKSLRLVLRRHNEALWFFPKSGTSLWDIAASDAILRSLGGKVSDKFGRPLDYSKSRTEAENIDGIIASSDGKLHAECIRIFQEKDWDEE